MESKPKPSLACLSREEWKQRCGIFTRAKGRIISAIGSVMGELRRTSPGSAVLNPIPISASSWSSPQIVPRVSCTTDERVAAQIMGRNFLGLDAVITKFGVTMTEDELLSYPEIPWSEEELNEVKDTHLLVAGYPLSIIEIRAKAPRTPKTFYRYEDGWYNNQQFATEERVGLHWYLIRKSPVANSTSKTWKEQQKLILSNEDVPRACELVYAIVLYYMATGERLFPNVWARVADIGSGGYHVYVGGFGADGLNVSYYWDDYRDGGLGCSSARKSE